VNNRSNHEHQQEKELKMLDEKAGDAAGSGSIYGIENRTNIHLNQEIKLIHVRYLTNRE
jgi:hypothetical protein